MDLSWFVNTRAIDTEDMERKPNRVKTRAGLWKSIAWRMCEKSEQKLRVLIGAGHNLVESSLSGTL